MKLSLDLKYIVRLTTPYGHVIVPSSLSDCEFLIGTFYKDYSIELLSVDEDGRYHWNSITLQMIKYGKILRVARRQMLYTDTKELRKIALLPWRITKIMPFASADNIDDVCSNYDEINRIIVFIHFAFVGKLHVDTGLVNMGRGKRSSDSMRFYNDFAIYNHINKKIKFDHFGINLNGVRINPADMIEAYRDYCTYNDLLAD